MSGFFPLQAAQVLSGDDRAAGSQGGEGPHQQDVYRVHQGYGGDRRFAHLGNHDGVQQAHGNGQELFDDQRDNQAPEVPVREINLDWFGFHWLSFFNIIEIPGDSYERCSERPGGR